MTDPAPSTRLPPAWELVSGLTGQHLVALWDYDGTLAPIVRDPSRARLPDRVRLLLARLAECGTVGVVSGRDLEDLRALVGVDGLIYVGNHGLEIQIPGTDPYIPPEVAEVQAELIGVERELRDATGGLAGVLIERKRFSVAVHTRGALTEGSRARAATVAGEVVSDHPGLRVQYGKEVIELRLDVSWDKGKAVALVLDSLAGEDLLGLYVGDDRTDEDAFAVIRARGGWAVVVGDLPETSATHRLDDQGNVGPFLEAVVEAACSGRSADRGE